MRMLASHLVAFVLLAVLSTLAAASDFANAPSDILEVRKHRHHHHHHHHHHHTTSTSKKHHHRPPTEPTGRKHHHGHKKPNAGEDVHKTTRHHHPHSATTSTKAASKPTKTVTTLTTTKSNKPTTTPVSPPAPKGTHKYGLMYSDKIRGVSAGNWLVVENWMDVRLDAALNAIAVKAPASVVKKNKGKPIVDEYTLGLYADRANATILLKEHFDTWMTEKDWKRIAKAGLNSVRIPFPHFAFPDAIEDNIPYFSLNRLDKLKEGVLLAKKYGLKVWISLHSLPGSQNGYDSSGRIGPAKWATSPEYTTLSKRAFNHLVSIFSQEPYASAVLAIEPANEPTAAQDDDILQTLRNFYPLAFDLFHSAKQRNLAVGAPASNQLMFAAHDGWKGMRYWAQPAFFNETVREQMLLGMHPYYIFGDVVHNMTDSQRVAKACLFGDKIANYSSVYTIVASECGINAPRGDNGWGRDMHQADHLQFDDENLDYPFSDEYMRFLALNFRAQQQAYERGAGWMLWSWKHYQHRDWSYKSGLRYGWLPRSAAELDQQPFGKLCP
ncbi:hypothetical protein OC834_003378 [Tilletia horrida]|nr:hypothetical protein OC834_003378 [Tilletia horrida]